MLIFFFSKYYKYTTRAYIYMLTMTVVYLQNTPRESYYFIYTYNHFPQVHRCIVPHCLLCSIRHKKRKNKTNRKANITSFSGDSRDYCNYNIYNVRIYTVYSAVRRLLLFFCPQQFTRKMKLDFTLG